MDKWWNIAIVNLLLLSSFLYFREVNKENYNAEDFAEPIDCTDEGFDLSAYLKTQSNPKSPLVHFWYEKMYDKVGRAHQFMSIGKGWGESCLRNKNGAGCAPFQNVIKKFNQLERCLENIPADGEWMNKSTIDGHFNDVQYSDVEKIITRLAMLANKPAQEWKRPSLLAQMTSKPKQVSKCVEETITRKQLKCLPVLFGAPGFDGLTLQDHYLHGKYEKHRFISHDCQIAPVCSRLAAQRLYHFQTMFFEPNYLKGGWRSSVNLNRKDIWVTIDGKVRNQGCEIDPVRFGGVLCWQYTKCARSIMAQLCSEYEQCCPSLKVHQKCRRGLNCNVC